MLFLILVLFSLTYICDATLLRPDNLSLIKKDEQAYKPVLMMHGIDSEEDDFNRMTQIIHDVHPGTQTFALAIFDKLYSDLNLNLQLLVIEAKINQIIKNNTEIFKNGYHLLCHSQGALICRCLSETMDNHQIDTLISMAGPQMGVYDEAFFNKSHHGEIPLPDAWIGFALNEIYLLAYTSLGQDMLSVANMWHDPKHLSSFMANNKFLPYLNNLIPHKNTERFKANFLRLSKAVFLVGDMGEQTYDGGIGPWQTALFGYLDGDGKSNIPMESQAVFTQDTFGLKTMSKDGRLVMKSVPNVDHSQWILDSQIINDYILEHLI